MNTAFNKITQGHLEAWAENYLNIPKEKRLSKSVDYGTVVRVAIEAGWFTNGQYTPSSNGTAAAWKIDGVSVADMEGRDVTRLAMEINEIYTEATTVPLD